MSEPEKFLEKNSRRLKAEGTRIILTQNPNGRTDTEKQNRKKADIEREVFDEELGAEIWQRSTTGGKMNGHPIELEIPEPSFDDESRPEGPSAAAGVLAGITLGIWCGSDPVRQFALNHVLGLDGRSVSSFSAKSGVSRTTIHLKIKEARLVIAKLSTELPKVVYTPNTD